MLTIYPTLSEVVIMCKPSIQIRATLKTLKGFANEARDMIKGAMRRDWGDDTPYNFALWLVDWLLRLRCWLFGVPCLYCKMEGAHEPTH